MREDGMGKITTRLPPPPTKFKVISFTQPSDDFLDFSSKPSHTKLTITPEGNFLMTLITDSIKILKFKNINNIKILNKNFKGLKFKRNMVFSEMC